MIKNLMQKLALRSLKKKIEKEERNEITNKFISQSVNFIFIMPEEPSALESAFDIVKYFKIHKKNCTLLLLETSYSRVSDEGLKLIPYNKLETNKLGLPGGKIKENLIKSDYDILINFNLRSDLFVAGMCSLINAKYKIGFWGDLLPESYNFMIKTEQINPEISYRNLLNSLQMF